VSGLTAGQSYAFNVYGSNSAGAGLWSSASNSVTPPIPSGSLWAWGYNNNGQLGLSDKTDRSSPTQVGYTSDWVRVASGTYLELALKSNGTLWSWGFNTDGQLGLGTAGPGNYTSSPQQIGALTNWSSIASGGLASFAIKTDGSLWAWGRNTSGQLGLSNLKPYSSPVQVGSLTNWLSIATGQYNVCAIKTDGTLWSWGINASGESGLGNRTNYSSPMQVGALTNWSAVAVGLSGVDHTMAVKTDGTLWAWGRNDTGQLGLGNRTNYSSPVQVGALTNWKTPAAGLSFTGVIKKDGTLWTWGNWLGLGLGSSNNYSSPKQVGGLTNWSTIGSGYYHSLSIKTDGTLWTWGYNNVGELGLNGTPLIASSPVQVGNLTTWIWASGFAPYESWGVHT